MLLLVSCLFFMTRQHSVGSVLSNQVHNKGIFGMRDKSYDKEKKLRSSIENLDDRNLERFVVKKKAGKNIEEQLEAIPLTNPLDNSWTVEKQTSNLLQDWGFSIEGLSIDGRNLKTSFKSRLIWQVSLDFYQNKILLPEGVAGDIIAMVGRYYGVK